MSSKLNFTISVPDNCISQISSPAPANQSQPRTTQPIRDSIDRCPQVSQNATHCFGQAWDMIVNFLKNIWGCLYCKKRVEALNPEEIERRRAVQERELAVWQRQMAINLKQPGSHSNFVDLRGQINEPGHCQALQLKCLPQIGHYKENYPLMNPYLSVKLPARQLHRFPEAIRSALSNYDADHLDIYFMIWQDFPRVLEGAHQRGKRNLIYHPIAYPNAHEGETHNHNLSMGIFDTEGIERASGTQWQVMPFNQFGEQNVHIHPGRQEWARGPVMCISPDDARFYLPDNRAWSTFNSACKLPNGRAAAVFGVILNSNDQTLASHVLLNPLYRNFITLQEYKNGIQSSSLDANLKGKMLNVLDFYTET